MGRAGNRTLGVLSVLMLFALISCSRGAENIEKSGEKILSHSTYSGDAGSIGIISKWEARERRLKIIYLVFVPAAVFIVFSVIILEKPTFPIASATASIPPAVAIFSWFSAFL